MKKTKEQRLEELRTLYKQASTSREKEEIVEIAQKIKQGYLCHECGLYGALPDEPHFPFCSDVCHKQYAETNYPPKDAPHKSVEAVILRIQERIKAIQLTK